MRHPKQKRSKHDTLVGKLEERLKQQKMNSGKSTFLKFLTYGNRTREVVGEIDLLEIEPSGVINFYEVKSNYSKKSRSTAQEQFERFKDTYPTKRIRGFIYCGDDLISLRK